MEEQILLNAWKKSRIGMETLRTAQVVQGYLRQKMEVAEQHKALEQERALKQDISELILGMVKSHGRCEEGVIFYALEDRFSMPIAERYCSEILAEQVRNGVLERTEREFAGRRIVRYQLAPVLN